VVSKPRGVYEYLVVRCVCVCGNGGWIIACLCVQCDNGNNANHLLEYCDSCRKG